MKKLLSIALLFATSFGFAQTRTFNTKVKINKFSNPTINDSIVTINSNNEIGFIKKSDLLSGSNNSQDLSINGQDLSISDGNTVTLPSSTPTASNGLNVDSVSGDVKLGISPIVENTYLSVNQGISLNIDSSFFNSTPDTEGDINTIVTSDNVFTVEDRGVSIFSSGTFVEDEVADPGALTPDTSSVNVRVSGVEYTEGSDQVNVGFNIHTQGNQPEDRNHFSFAPNAMKMIFETFNRNHDVSHNSGGSSFTWRNDGIGKRNRIDISSNGILLNSETNNVSTAQIQVNEELIIHPSNSANDASQNGFILSRKNNQGAVEWIPATAGGSPTTPVRNDLFFVTDTNGRSIYCVHEGNKLFVNIDGIRGTVSFTAGVTIHRFGQPSYTGPDLFGLGNLCDFSMISDDGTQFVRCRLEGRDIVLQTPMPSGVPFSGNFTIILE